MTPFLVDKVYNFTSEKALFSAPCHVLVGVSGGADSMALLHCLTHWPVPGLRVSVLHIHHGLRGETADRDAAFVLNYCNDNGIYAEKIHVDVVAFAKENGLSIEDAGRWLRYESFEERRVALGADYILTAHSADDQVETVLMRILRGTGTDGLAGIPAVRGAIRRPLLNCSRTEIEDYCASENIPYVTDETNTDECYTRNRVRHSLLPILRQFNPSVDTALLRLSANAAEDATFLRDKAYGALNTATTDAGVTVSGILEQPLPIQRRMLSLLLKEQDVPTIEAVHLTAMAEMMNKGEGDVCLPGGITAAVYDGLLRFYPTDDPSVHWESVTIDSVPCTITLDDHTYTLSLLDNTDDPNVYKMFSNRIVDYDTIQGSLYVRTRNEGDYLHPQGRHIGKSLKKLMNEWKIPVRERASYPLLCDDRGVVLVPGYACDQRVSVTSDTKHFLVWESTNESV